MSDSLGNEGQAAASGGQGPREALTRVLAIEGRNALARVELAASELSRFEATPAVRARIETIRSAADEIEGLFAKIDLLSTPRSEQHWPTVPVEHVFHQVEARIASTLRARNATVLWRPREGAVPARLEIPEATLERLLVALIRLGLNLSRGAGDFVLESEADADLVSIMLQLPHDSHRRVSNTAARDARVDLDVQLAEWGGLCMLQDDVAGTRLVLSLPAEALHAS